MRRKSSEKQEVEAECIGYLPERFTAGYFELVRLGLQVDPNGQSFDRGGSAPKRRYHQHAGGLRDEPALRFKAWVDRQLRAIGRDVQAYLNARDATGPSPIGISPDKRRQIARDLERRSELKCRRGCGNFVSWQWKFCPWCGKVIDDEARNDATTGEEAGAQVAVGVLLYSSGEAGTDAAGEDGSAARQDDQREDGSATEL